jgi:predicted RNA methylase
LKTRYLIFFPAGLGGLVVSQLAKDLKNVAAEFRDDSACVITSTSESAEVARLLYVKNAFIVQNSISSSSVAGAAKAFEEWLRRGGRLTLGRNRPRNFRVMAHVNGGLQGIPPRARQSLEQSIGRATRTVVQSRGDGDEYWLVERKDTAVKYLGWRIPRRRRENPVRGSLGPELSYLMITASDPTRNDVFLDPFAGSGALPLARTNFPAKEIIASDLRDDFELLAKANTRVTTHRRDFFDESAFGDTAVNVIVTDPPWGEHDEVSEKFLDALAIRFKALLSGRRGARLVVLMTRSLAEDLASALRDAGFSGVRSTEILVNGHPASVLQAVVQPAVQPD